MRGGVRLGRIAAAFALAASLAGTRPALAGDRVDDLTALLSNSSEKTRLTAALSLAKLGDKRAMKPLVQALQDPSAPVRVAAAAGLGKLAHKAALPALKTAATDDSDETVRKAAREAATLVAKANKIDLDLAGASPAVASAATSPTAPSQARKTTGFGRSPHAVDDRPDLYVTVKGVNDDSPGKADKATRKAHADALMAAINNDLRRARQVTMLDNDAQRWGLEQRQLDVSVVKLDVTQSGGYVEVTAELRLAISDNKGKMLSFLSGGAKVQVPMGKYRAAFLPNMRKEAIQGALDGLFDKLLAHLRQITTT